MEAYSEVYAPEQIDEAEGSYGQTPKARQAMGKLAIARREKPASEYSQKGEKTKKVKSIEKHTRRIDNGPDVGNRGKKSTKPRHSGFLGKSGRGKMDQDSRDYARDSAVEYTAGGHKPGPGTVTKNPKKLRKQKAMGEQVDIFDIVLEFLQAEGYAETLEEAEWMMANLIDEEAISIITELTGGKGHPGYKAGSKDHGPMQSGHSADTFKRTMKGGTMSQRHGDHLGDLDDKDDDEDDLEAGLKDSARKRRENVRKPLRNKVKAARKVLSKEEYVDEAQHARENPEKYEREQAKKSAPVRGERTPMPPRGDKRREDFEKWYAANVR